MLRSTDRKLKSLLQTKGRIDQYLGDLICAYKQKPFKKPFLSRLKKSTNVFAALKFMMVLHNLIYEGLIDTHTCDGYLKKLVYKMEGTAQRYMVEKFLNPYKLYLQKRNGLNFKIDKGDESEVEMQIFKLMNQIKLVETFSQMIYTMGRYFPNYEFATDFNIIIAKDVQKMYSEITILFCRNQNRFIMLQIQLLHQVMYPIFFNNYFHKSVYSYRPIWILTDVVSSTPTKTKHKNTNSTAQNTSQTLQNNRQQQEKVSQFTFLQDSQQLKKQFDLSQQNPLDKLLICQFALIDIPDIHQDLSFQQDQLSIAA